MSADFPDVHWDELAERMSRGGSQAVIDFIERFEDRAQRRQLFSLAQRGFGGRPWEGKNLDAVTDVVEAGIADALNQAELETDPTERAKRIDFANVLSYNLSAALAECWDDGLERRREHFEVGLEAADACLRWREELKKGPGPFSMATWARGMHLLSLERVDESRSAFLLSLRHAQEDAVAHGGFASLDARGYWSVLLYNGYLALAQRAAGHGGDELFALTLAALDEGVRTRPDDAEDLQFCADQLRTAERVVARRFGSSS